MLLDRKFVVFKYLFSLILQLGRKMGTWRLHNSWFVYGIYTQLSRVVLDN